MIKFSVSISLLHSQKKKSIAESDNLNLFPFLYGFHIILNDFLGEKKNVDTRYIEKQILIKIKYMFYS